MPPSRPCTCPTRLTGNNSCAFSWHARRWPRHDIMVTWPIPGFVYTVGRMPSSLVFVVRHPQRYTIIIRQGDAEARPVKIRCEEQVGIVVGIAPTRNGHEFPRLQTVPFRFPIRLRPESHRYHPDGADTNVGNLPANSFHPAANPLPFHVLPFGGHRHSTAAA